MDKNKWIKCVMHSWFSFSCFLFVLLYQRDNQGTYGSRSDPPFFTVSFAEQTKEPSKDEDEDDDEDDEDDDELNLKRPRYETHLRTAIARVHSQDLAQQWAWMCAYY